MLATNIAETSLTVPGIKYVIDPGTARISRYSHRLKVQRLPIEPVSQASAEQRKGRCGRTSDGVCIRLYSEDDFDTRPEFTDPEILRTSLASVILQMAALGLGEMADFPFIDPPDARNVADGVRLLVELGALQSGRGRPRLTGIGRKLARLPLDPRLGRMIIEADRNGCTGEVLIIAAALSIQESRSARPRPGKPPTRCTGGSSSRGRTSWPSSTCGSTCGTGSESSPGRPSGGCASTSTCTTCGCANGKTCTASSARRSGTWVVRAGAARASGDGPGGEAGQPQGQDAQERASGAGTPYPAGTGEPGAHLTAGRAAVAPWHAGHGPQAAGRQEAGPATRAGPVRRGAGARFAVFPDSSLAKKPPAWLMAAELVETSRLWGRCAAAIAPEWAEPLAGHLVTRIYSNPHWDARRGTAMASERVTLYGLPLVAGRGVNYAGVDPAAARDLFIQHALVEGDWQTHHKFFHANRRLLDEASDLERKARRRGIVVDDAALFEFYDQRIPADVTSARHFDSWWKKARASDPELLTFRTDDLVGPAAEEISPADYPPAWATCRCRMSSRRARHRTG